MDQYRDRRSAWGSTAAMVSGFVQARKVEYCSSFDWRAQRHGWDEFRIAVGMGYGIGGQLLERSSGRGNTQRAVILSKPGGRSSRSGEVERVEQVRKAITFVGQSYSNESEREGAG